MDSTHQLMFEIDSYDGLGRVFETHIKDLVLTAIEEKQFDTRVSLDETYECTQAEIFEIMSQLGTPYTTYSAAIVTLNDDFLLKSEVIREDGLIRFKLWFLCRQAAIAAVKKLVSEKFSKYFYTTMALDISWAINGQQTGVNYIDIQTELNEVIEPEAYPYIPNLTEYVNEYLTHKAPVLLMIGPPGTGKTRLIKHIIKAIGLKKNAVNVSEDREIIRVKNPYILYSMEDKIFKDDQFFVRFFSEPFDAMVIEDIDFNLGSRKDGNTFMYKLLGGSDGLVSGVKRKIILSTNLRGVSNIDEALLRPGRCFDTIHTRSLFKNEASLLADKLGKNLSAVKTKDNKEEFTLAEIYNIKS